MDARVVSAKEDTTQLPDYFVAVGASAGGLEAIDEFFTNMPTDSGVGFIVIQQQSSCLAQVPTACVVSASSRKTAAW